MDSRFNRQKANLRSYLRKRGAEIDVKHKTVRVDVDSLNRKEVGRLRELERWGYKVNERKNSPPRNTLRRNTNLKMIHLSLSLMK